MLGVYAISKEEIGGELRRQFIAVEIVESGRE